MNSLMDHDRLPMDWVGDWAGRRRALTPQRPAVIDLATAQQLDFAELDSRVNRLAALLDARGVEQGDVIVLMSANHLEALELFLACGKLGAVLAPISHRLTPHEAASLVARLQPKRIAHDAEREALVASLGDEVAGIPRFRLTGPDSDHAHALMACADTSYNRPLALADSALIVHTGGSTGLPKLCRISHRQMVWNAIELLVACPDGLGARRELVLFPFFHIGGWNTVIPVLYGGGCVILQPAFDAEGALAAIERYGVNHFGAVEAMLQAMAHSPAFPTADLSSLAGITTAGAPCAEASMAPFLDRGIPVSQAYGLTEAGPSNFLHAREGETVESLRASHATVGQPFYHCDYRIVDPETGAEVPSGTPGELQLRSPHTFDGYLDDAEASARRLAAGGWVRSGDLAVRMADDQVRIIGRIDNVIVSGGENIAAEELEAVLGEHPDVDSALVFGVPDPHWGERPVAWVTGRLDPAADPRALADWLDARLARFKQPAVVVRVAALPFTGAGKPDRREARRQHLANSQGDKP